VTGGPRYGVRPPIAIPWETESGESMAKRTKRAKPTKPRSQASGVMIHIDPLEPDSPSQSDFNRARDLLRQRAAALILDLAKRYVASKAAELTTVLDAIDSLAEFERMHRPAVDLTVAPRRGPGDLVSSSTEGGVGPPTASGISFIADKADADAVMATGTVKWFNPQKGFGFIVHAATGKDVFVHISAVEKAGLTKLNEGQQVESKLEESRGKASAVNLKLK
jgi:CspA family cold shock protein